MIIKLRVVLNPLAYNFMIIFHDKNYVDHRSTLPLVMQEGCETIYPARLHNTMHGEEAYKHAEEDKFPYVGEVFGPPPHSPGSKYHAFKTSKILSGGASSRLCKSIRSHIIFLVVLFPMIVKCRFVYIPFLMEMSRCIE